MSTQNLSTIVCTNLEEFQHNSEYTRMLMERHTNYPYYKDTNQLIVGCNQWEIGKEKEMRYEREESEIKREQAQQEKQHRRLKKKLGWTMLN